MPTVKWLETTGKKSNALHTLRITDENEYLKEYL
jgi:hypothetical protein